MQQFKFPIFIAIAVVLSYKTIKNITRNAHLAEYMYIDPRGNIHIPVSQIAT